MDTDEDKGRGGNSGVEELHNGSAGGNVEEEDRRTRVREECFSFKRGRFVCAV